MNQQHRPADGWPWEPSPNRLYFYYAPGGDINYYATEKERDAAAADAIDNQCDEFWTEEVDQIIAGKITHTTHQINRIERPPESEIDDEGYDKNGECWHPEWQYQCEYKLLPIQLCNTPPIEEQKK